MPVRIPLWDKFPVNCIIYQKRGNSLLAVKDKARFVTKKGLRYYELKKLGTKFSPSSFDNIITMQNGKPFIQLYEYERNHVVPLDMTHLETIFETNGNGTVQTIEAKYKCLKKGHFFEEPEKKGERDICPWCKTASIQTLKEPVKTNKIKGIVNLIALNEGMVFWGQMRRWQAEARHRDESWFQRNKDFIIMCVLFIFCIVMFWMFSNAMTDSANKVVLSMDKVVQALNPQGTAPVAPG